MIRPATSDDAPAIAGIYNHYIENTVITFEEEPVSSEEFLSRMTLTPESRLPWIVHEDETSGAVLGYAYAAPWGKRSAYRNSVEASIYLHHAATARGIGKALYSRLLEELTSLGYHVVIGGVALPNPSSVALHEKLGFVRVAHYREVGRKFGRWIDVAYWQKYLDGPGGEAETREMYAAIFSSKLSGDRSDGYRDMADRMVELASGQPGFLGVESVRGEDGFGITISYWDSEESIRGWKQQGEHLEAQRLGKEKWYDFFDLKISRVVRQYKWRREGRTENPN